MREQSRNPNGALRPANKYSYQNISCFFEQEITCKVLIYRSDSGGFPAKFAHIVEFGPPHPAAVNQLDFIEHR